MRHFRVAHGRDEFSPRQFHLLELLGDGGAIGQTELGLILNTDPSVLVTLLNPLEDNGLVSRERDRADRRRHVVTITEAGKKRLEEANRVQHEAEQELFAGLDIGQVEQLRTLLTDLRESSSLAGLGYPQVPTDAEAADPDC